jgi:hypothetical protein
MLQASADGANTSCAAQSLPRGGHSASADLFDANDADELHRAEAFGAEILELSVALGGSQRTASVSAQSMCVQFSAEELVDAREGGVRPRWHGEPRAR